MSEIPGENYERQIRYELTRDIFVSDEYRTCTRCKDLVNATYIGECMKCTRRSQYMAEDCFKEADKKFKQREANGKIQQ